MLIIIIIFPPFNKTSVRTRSIKNSGFWPLFFFFFLPGLLFQADGYIKKRERKKILMIFVIQKTQIAFWSSSFVHLTVWRGERGKKPNRIRSNRLNIYPNYHPVSDENVTSYSKSWLSTHCEAEIWNKPAVVSLVIRLPPKKTKNETGSVATF